MNANDEIMRRAAEQPASTPANVRALVERVAELEVSNANCRHDFLVLFKRAAAWKRAAKKMFAALKIIMTTIANHVGDDLEQLAALYEYDDLGVGVLLDSAENENARLRRQLENVSALVPYWQRQLEETRNGNSLIALMRKADLVDLKMALQAGAEDAGRPEQAEGGRE